MDFIVVSWGVKSALSRARGTSSAALGQATEVPVLFVLRYIMLCWRRSVGARMCYRNKCTGIVCSTSHNAVLGMVSWCSYVLQVQHCSSAVTGVLHRATSSDIPM